MPGSTLLYVILEALLLPWVMLYLLAGAKHRKSLLRRFGAGLPAMDGSLWVHAVSVGEFLAGKRLIAALEKAYPETPLVVSTVTLTGAHVAQGAKARHVFFPFDLPIVVERFLKRLKPRAVIILETEIWPYLLRACHRRGIPVAICNGRLSEKSYRRYKRFAWILRPFFRNIPLILAQADPDAERFRALGAPRVEVTGNIKYDAALPVLPPAAAAVYHAFTSGRSGWVAGSTMPGEERLVLEAHKEILKRDPEAFLILAPRHPERADEVMGLIRESGFTVMRRSNPDAGGARVQVMLLDTVGELAHAYRFGRVCFVGGSLVPTGGHNIIEPALHRRCTIIGPHYENFKGIVRDFLDAGAVAVVAPEAFASRVAELYRDPGAYGERAHGVVIANQGSLARTMKALKPLL